MVSSKFPQPPHRSSRNATSPLLYYKSKAECENSKSCSILIKFLDAPSKMFSQLQDFVPPLSEQVWAGQQSLSSTQFTCANWFPIFLPQRTGACRTAPAVPSSVRTAWSLLSTTSSRTKEIKGKEEGWERVSSASPKYPWVCSLSRPFCKQNLFVGCDVV